MSNFYVWCGGAPIGKDKPVDSVPNPNYDAGDYDASEYPYMAIIDSYPLPGYPIKKLWVPCTANDFKIVST